MSSVHTPTAPPVVAAVVVHDPGEWFDDVLEGLAAQDYPNLRYLFLVTGGEPESRIMARLPSAFVRRVEGNPGFGPTANTVLELVEGENGFFCFVHDDAALEPSTIRLLVEELYRSNAGIVGPKLVDWDDPRRLQGVGLAVDRAGEVDPLVEPGELDQEQHDSVRDVFALPSACLLVRADLFRTLSFDPSIDFHGDDLDLCWRAHLLGARVLLVPAARVRHRGLLVTRRPDLPHRRLMSRHRVTTVSTLTGARRLPWVVLWMLVVTLGELFVGIFTGRARAPWTTLMALLGCIPRSGTLFARRREVRALRQVPDHEVAELQLRGSAPLARFLRARQSGVSRTGGAGSDGRQRRLRRSPTAAFIAWIVVLVVALVGSRHLITGGLAAVGEFLPFPDGPGTLFDSYRSGWWEHAMGSSAASPTGLALVGLAGVATWAHMGLAHTVLSVGLLFVGYLGAWRLCSVLPGDRARVAGLVVYAAVPLPYASIAGGRWSGLLVYAAMPWVVHLLRVISGLGSGVDLDTAPPHDTDPLAPHGADIDGVSARRHRVRSFAGLVLVAAVVVAFVPSFVVVMVLVGLALGAATLIASGRLGAAVIFVGATVIASVLALTLHLPWSLRFFDTGGRAAFLGAPLAGARGEGIVDLARFGVGGSSFGVLAIGLYLPVLVAPLIARGWRFGWSVRAALLVVVPGVLLVAADRGSIPELVSDPAVLMAPIALGLALAAACAVASFSEDIRGVTFGWRQPLGLLTAIAVGIGLLPVLVAAAGGRWDQAETSISQLLEQLPTDPSDGDYRVLHVGDPRVLTVPGFEYREGIAYALTDDGSISMPENWLSVPSVGVRSVSEVLDAVANDQTARAGRALAPLGVRFIVVPLVDGASSTIDQPLPAPEGLLDAFGDQLDLRRRYASSELVILENTAWMPVRALLTEGAAATSQSAGLDALARADLAGASPIMVGQTDASPVTATVSAGVVHLSVPKSDGWRLELDGSRVAARSSFGTVTAWDLDRGGVVELRFDTPTSRGFVVLAQTIVWAIVAFLAVSGGSWRWRRRRPEGVRAEPPGPGEPSGPVLNLAGELDLPDLPEVGERSP